MKFACLDSFSVSNLDVHYTLAGVFSTLTIMSKDKHEFDFKVCDVVIFIDIVLESMRRVADVP